MANPFDQFDVKTANPFDKFDVQQVQPQPDTGILSNAKDFLSAAGHHALNGVHGVAQLVENGVAKGASLLPDNPVSRYIQKTADADNAAMADRERQYQASTPNSPGAYAGATVGEIGGLAAGGIPKLLTGVSTKVAAPVTSAVTKVLPKSVANAVGSGAGYAAQGAVIGAAQPVVDAPDQSSYFNEKLDQLGTGAALGAAIPGVVNTGLAAGKYAGGTVKSLIQPFTEKGQSVIAGKVISKFAEGGPTSLNTTELVAGSSPTLAEATGNAGLATLQRGTRDLKPNLFADRELQNSQARIAAFDSVAGDSQKLEQAKSSRSDMAKELYGSAMKQGIDPAAVTPEVQGQITQLLDRPSIQAAMKDAKNLAAEDGLKLTDDTSIQGLHYTKLSLDQQINDAARAGNNTLARSLMGTKDLLEGVMTKLSPAYAEARTKFAELSQPVNAMETLQKLKVTDAQGNITLAKIQNAINALEGKMMGPGTNAAKSVGRDQMDTLKAIRDDLLRQSNLGAGKSIGSNTFQNMATDNILQSTLGSWLGSKAGLPTVVGQAGKLIYGNSNEAIRNKLADMMLNPELAGDALQRSNSLASPAAQKSLMNRLSPYYLPAATSAATERLTQP